MADRNAVIRRAEVSIRAPCEGSDGTTPQAIVVMAVSIRAPCEGSDLALCGDGDGEWRFNPRSL